jgi:hypothetical protein
MIRAQKNFREMSFKKQGIKTFNAQEKTDGGVILPG